MTYSLRFRFGPLPRRLHSDPRREDANPNNCRRGCLAGREGPAQVRLHGGANAKVWRYSFSSGDRKHGVEIVKGKETIHQLLDAPKVEVSVDAPGGARPGEASIRVMWENLLPRWVWAETINFDAPVAQLDRAPAF